MSCLKWGREAAYYDDQWSLSDWPLVSIAVSVVAITACVSLRSAAEAVVAVLQVMTLNDTVWLFSIDVVKSSLKCDLSGSIDITGRSDNNR